jgi:CubicO group peptidase (beta-lactamase class C family)
MNQIPLSPAAPRRADRYRRGRTPGATIVSLFLLIPPAPAVAQQPHPDEIDAIVRAALAAWEVPGVAVAVVRDAEVVYLRGHGVRERGKPDPLTPDTLFPIASCTKAFTTTAMAMLVDEGKMGWDDPVRKHLPWFKLSDPLADANVTLRDLVTHCTGLAGHDLLWYRSPWDRDDIIRRAGRLPLKHSFRSTFQYQSTMFAAAGACVEAASGLPWEQFIQKRLLDPLGMTATCFTSTAAERSPDHASPHRKDARGELAVIPWYPLTRPDPAGSVVSNARELARWVQFQLGDGSFGGRRLVSAQNLAETHSPQMVIRLEGNARAMNPDTNQLDYGLGWVLQDYRGQFLVSHAGAIDGFRAHVTLVPHARLGLVLLNNRHATQMNLALSNRLVDHLLGLAPRDWNEYLAKQVEKGDREAHARLVERLTPRRPASRPSHPGSAYAGTYEDAAYGTAEVSQVSGGLVWKWSSFTCDLEHFEDDTFVVRNDLLGFPRVTFTTGGDNQVTGMKFLDVLEVEFRKVRAPDKSGG